MKSQEMCSPHPPLMEEFHGRQESQNAKILRAFHRIGRVNVSTLMEVTPGEFFVLQIIEKYNMEHPQEEGIYVSKIAQMAKMASPQVSRMLKNLENHNLIRRDVDVRDRRNTYVFLTEEGKKVSERTQLRMERYVGRVIGCMGEEQVNELVRLCNQMADVMEQELQRELEEKPEIPYNRKERRSENGENI